MLICGTLWLQVLVVLNAVIQLESLKSWGSKKPLFPPQNIPDGALNPRRAVVRRKIVLYHNFFRTKVRPTSANMLFMSWHAGAAQQAQKYADQCAYLVHNSPLENSVPHLGACGQNLFVSSYKIPWFFALKTWFTEYQNFTYGHPAVDLKSVGHYTQMVWATSHKVGCGIAHCRGGPWGHFYNYVCHYCPGGNHNTITHYPYKRGNPCEDCPDNCVSGSLCTNACPRRDMYSNCNELVKQTYFNVCQQGTCNATCVCGTKLIHKNYPWN